MVNSELLRGPYDNPEEEEFSDDPITEEEWEVKLDAIVAHNGTRGGDGGDTSSGSDADDWGGSYGE